MAQQTYKVARLTDNQIASILNALATEFGPFSVGIQALTQSIGSVSFPDSDLPVWQSILLLKSDLIDHLGGSVAGVTLYYYRGGVQGQPHEKSPVLDDVVVDTQGPDVQRLKIAARIIELFRPVQLLGTSDPLGKC